MATLIVPWRSQSARQPIWDWLRRRYRRAGWRPIVATYSGATWNKARAVMPLVEAAPDGIVIVADADVWCDGLASAVRAVTCGVAEWAMPHDLLYRLSAEATSRVLRGMEPSIHMGLDQRPYHGIPGGGIVVAHRATLLAAPLDKRFDGWGQEDESWGWALGCMAGEPWRGEAPMFHLWHPPAERMTRRRGTPEGWHLRCRYREHQANPDAMRMLLEGAWP